MVKKYIPDSMDIVWLDFNPQSGHEQKGKRPALVLSPKKYNEKSSLCLCVPITSKIKNYPFEVLCNIKNKQGVILSDQVKSIDYKARNMSFIRKIDAITFMEVKSKIALLLDI